MDPVTNITLLQSLKSTVLGFWTDRKNDFFPAPLPVSLMRKNFGKLTRYAYVISIKTDGTRYLLMCHNGSTYFIDRSFSFFKAKENFNMEIYGNETDGCGILFDGELIAHDNNSNISKFIVHDCICAFGKDVSNENFTERYENVIYILANLWSTENSQILLEPKKFYKFHEIDVLLEDMQKTKYASDGLIFTPVNLPIGTQSQYTLFKWKKKDNHTFDFKIEDGKRKYSLFVMYKIDLKLFATVDKFSDDGIKLTKLLKQNCPNFKSGDIVECTYNTKSFSFEPKLLRTDKPTPNSLSTVEKTLENIEENITLDNLVKLIKNIK